MHDIGPVIITGIFSALIFGVALYNAFLLVQNADDEIKVRTSTLSLSLDYLDSSFALHYQSIRIYIYKISFSLSLSLSYCISQIPRVRFNTVDMQRFARLDVCIYSVRRSNIWNQLAFVFGSHSIQTREWKGNDRKAQQAACLRSTFGFVLHRVGRSGMARLHVRCVPCKRKV